MKTISKKESQGFTIVEMIVVIAIFAIITSVALFNQGKLNSNILVNNLAYEIALAVRETQTYGIGVRAGASGTSFEGGYGISFDISKPNQIVTFTDNNSNHVLDAGEEVATFTISNQRGNKITAICRGVTSNSQKCVGGSDHNVSILNILFRRPNPEAIFFSVRNGISTASTDDIPGPAYIVVNTPSGDNCRVVVVEKTGQIEVNNGASGLCDNGTSGGSGNFTP